MLPYTCRCVKNFGESRQRFFREFLGVSLSPRPNGLGELESEDSWKRCGKEGPCGLEPSNVRKLISISRRKY